MRMESKKFVDEKQNAKIEILSSCFVKNEMDDKKGNQRVFGWIFYC